MWLQAKIKCEKNATPYRIFINEELITERFYACPKNWIGNDKIKETTNVLDIELVDADDYTVRIENVPGYPKHKVWLHSIDWQEQRYED